MATTAGTNEANVRVPEGNASDVVGYVPRRKSSGVITGDLVECKAPVTVNLVSPVARTAEHAAVQSHKRLAKRHCTDAVIRSTAVAFVGVLSLAAVTVLCLHFLGHGQDDDDDDSMPRKEDWLSEEDRDIFATTPSQEANGTLPSVVRVSSNVTGHQDEPRNLSPSRFGDEGPAACGDPAEMFQCGDPARNDSGELVCPRYYSRAEWRAKPPKKRVPMIHPIKYVVVSHTTLSRCRTLDTCGKQIRSMQNYHLSRRYDDVAYNFMVSDDGSLYEGRGWDRSSSHMGQRGNTALGVTFLGDYSRSNLTEAQINSTLLLLELGLRCGYLDRNYELVAHNQTRDTKSPGQYAYQEIKNWLHYSHVVLF